MKKEDILKDFLCDDEYRRIYEQEKLVFKATEEISQLMKKENITKAALAEKLGTSKANVTQLLSGSRNMTLKTFAEILFVLGYSADFEFSVLDEKSSSRLIVLERWQKEKETIKYHYSAENNKNDKNLGIAG